MNKNKAKKFIKEHGTEIAVGTGIILGTVMCIIGGEQFHLPKKVLDSTVKNRIKNIDIPTNFAVGKITDLWEEGDEIVTITRNITVNDLGKLGREFIKHGIIKDGVEACAVIEFLKENI